MTMPSSFESPAASSTYRRAALVGSTVGGAWMLVLLSTGDAWVFHHKLTLWAGHGISAEEASSFVLREVALQSVLVLVSCLGLIAIGRARLWRRPGWNHGWRAVVSYGGIVLLLWLAHGVLAKLLIWKWGGQMDGWLAVGVSIVLAVVLGGAGGFAWGWLFADEPADGQTT